MLSSEAHARRQSLRRMNVFTSALSTSINHIVCFFSTSVSLSENRTSVHLDEEGSEYCKLSAARMSATEKGRECMGAMVRTYSSHRRNRGTFIFYTYYLRKLQGTHDNVGFEAESPSVLRNLHLSTSLPNSLYLLSLSQAWHSSVRISTTSSF